MFLSQHISPQTAQKFFLLHLRCGKRVGNPMFFLSRHIIVESISAECRRLSFRGTAHQGRQQTEQHGTALLRLFRRSFLRHAPVPFPYMPHIALRIPDQNSQPGLNPFPVRISLRHEDRPQSALLPTISFRHPLGGTENTFKQIIAEKSLSAIAVLRRKIPRMIGLRIHALRIFI